MAAASRLPTRDILGDVLGGNDLTPVALRWDYSQAGANAAQVQGYAQAIKRSETRATQEIVTAGENFLAVKALLPHGQWLDWLEVEFAMTERTAQRIMAVATAFGDKYDTVSHLSTSVLYLLAAPSTPKAAREIVIDAAATTPVTKAQAQALINEHKPRTVSPEQRPLTNSEMALINQGIAQDRADRAAQRALRAAPLSSAQQAAAWQPVRSGIPADLASLGDVQWCPGQGWRVVSRDGELFGPDLHSLTACLQVLRQLQAAVVPVDGGPLPAWAADDDRTNGGAWTLQLDQTTDPAALGRALRGLVDSGWMGRLWDAYMGDD